MEQSACACVCVCVCVCARMWRERLEQPDHSAPQTHAQLTTPTRCPVVFLTTCRPISAFPGVVAKTMSMRPGERRKGVSCCNGVPRPTCAADALWRRMLATRWSACSSALSANCACEGRSSRGQRGEAEAEGQAGASARTMYSTKWSTVFSVRLSMRIAEGERR